MLTNGLGSMLNELVPNSNRFVDLFSGSAAVATFVAERHNVEVIANDLQRYSQILAASIVARTEYVDCEQVWSEWESAASLRFDPSIAPPREPKTENIVAWHRKFSQNCSDHPITQAYGGHYFGAHQALEFDAFRHSVSTDPQIAYLQLAALIVAASQCVAAPGHTAQPFQPSETGIIYIAEAWKRSARDRIYQSLCDLSHRHAIRAGTALRTDANALASSCLEGDLVFIDPPYSGVHYSRFYHVLETIAEGSCGTVSGKGRYPDQSKRPISNYSMKSQSLAALDDLFRKLAKGGASAIVTFPDKECSNGMSGKDVRALAKKYFRVAEEVIESKFSSMGGRSDGVNAQAGRNARILTNEIVFHLSI